MKKRSSDDFVCQKVENRSERDGLAKIRNLSSNDDFGCPESDCQLGTTKNIENSKKNRSNNSNLLIDNQKSK